MAECFRIVFGFGRAELKPDASVSGLLCAHDMDELAEWLRQPGRRMPWAVRRRLAPHQLDLMRYTRDCMRVAGVALTGSTTLTDLSALCNLHLLPAPPGDAGLIMGVPWWSDGCGRPRDVLSSLARRGELSDDCLAAAFALCPSSSLARASLVLNALGRALRLPAGYLRPADGARSGDAAAELCMVWGFEIEDVAGGALTRLRPSEAGLPKHTPSRFGELVPLMAHLWSLQLGDPMEPRSDDGSA